MQKRYFFEVDNCDSYYLLSKIREIKSLCALMTEPMIPCQCRITSKFSLMI